nr:hypothetical protein [Plasmopara viticola lesion associated mononegaambi virus 3]
MADFIKSWSKSVSDQAENLDPDPLTTIEEELEDAAAGDVDLFATKGTEIAAQIETYLDATEQTPSRHGDHERKSSDNTAELISLVKQDEEALQMKRGQAVAASTEVPKPFVNTNVSVISRIKSPDNHSFTSQRETADMRAKLETVENRLSQMEILIDRLLGAQKATNPRLTAHDADITNLVASVKEMRSLIIESNKRHNVQYTQLMDHVSRLAELKITGSTGLTSASKLSASDLLPTSEVPELKDSVTSKLNDKRQSAQKKPSRASRMAPAF